MASRKVLLQAWAMVEKETRCRHCQSTLVEGRVLVFRPNSGLVREVVHCPLRLDSARGADQTRPCLGWGFGLVPQRGLGCDCDCLQPADRPG